MSFETYGVSSSAKSNASATVDYGALNKYVVETAGLQERETVAGYISAIVDLGTQKLPDAENKFDGDEDDEAAEIEKNPNTYFKDGRDPDTGKPCRLKCYPQKDQQCVAVAVDFPDIIVDKGEFFGKSKPQPLRLWMGGDFFVPEQGMVIARPTPLKVVNLDKTRKTKVWSFSPLHLFYKMAVGAKLIKAGETFLPNDIDKLLGKAFQFEVQVFFKENKGKEYYTEYIKFVGGLGRGQVVPEIANTPFMVQFNKVNKEENLKELRWHITNTMKRASNWGGSKVKQQIESLKGGQDSSESDGDYEEQEDTPVPPKKTPPKKNPPKDIDEDLSDLPF